jgi:signal transduction histidine kinase
MKVKTDKGGMTLALGDLLTVEDPVWVWDIRARRILWANRAGQAFWEADGLDALRARRFPARSSVLTRIAAQAGESAQSREWTETLTLPGRADKNPVTCYMQSLLVAGGQPGVIVRALDAPGKRGRPKPKLPPSRKSVPRVANGKAALKAVAARLDLDQGKTEQTLQPRYAAPPASASRNGAAARMPAEAPPSPAAVQSAAHAALIRELCHELRNPLTVIIGFAERIRDIDPSRARLMAKSYAENILEGAELALEILRDFSTRLRDGPGQPRQPQPVNVKSAVESCLRLVAPLAKQAGLTLGKSLGRRLPQLKTEERALKQMLLNVLLNAVRHQKTGGRISVKARRRRDGVLVIGVSDDGVGMTKKEIRAALGGKRAQVSENGALSGLGLPLVKRLVQDAGGTIAIESARRKGTTVEMSFPPQSLAPVA